MKLLKIIVSTAACLALSSLFGSAVAQTASLIRVTDTFNWEVPSPDPTGVVFIPGANALFIADSEVEETVQFVGSNVFQTELDGSPVEHYSTLDFTSEPTGISINPDNNHLFISTDNAPKRIFEIDPGPDGLYLNGDDIRTAFATRDFNCSDAEGVTYNPVEGVLHIACGSSNIIYTIHPGPNQLFDGVAPSGDDTVSSFSISSLGLDDPEGIAYDDTSGGLYIVGKPRSQLLHVTTSGQYIRTITLDSNLLYKPSGLAMGNSSLNNGAQSLYLVDRGVDNDSFPDENDGRLFEFALPSQASNAAPTIAISAPMDAETYQPGETVNFSASATDPEDGDLSTSVTWHSSIDGEFGSGAAFSTASLSIGLHTITASCVDSSLSQALDTIQIRVVTAGSMIVESRINSSSDDAEQRGPGGNTWISGNDLELIYDRTVAQIIGLRFNALSIPAGAVIEEAFIQFKADEAQSSPVLMEIRAQASDNAEPIQGRKKNLTDRNTTTASSNWRPADWLVIGEAGPSQKTSDLSAIVQEVVNRPGWSDGNSMAFLITGSDTASRTAESFDSEPDGAPLLHVRYSTATQALKPASRSAYVADTVDAGIFYNSALASQAAAVGEYMTASASDAEANTMNSDRQALIEVPGAPEVTTLSVRISHESDNAKEQDDGGMQLGGSALALVEMGNHQQQTGLRFNDLKIPRDAGILSAYVQFQAADTADELAFVAITAQDSDNSDTFNDIDHDISSRPRTAAQVNWFPPAWPTAGTAGPDQLTPDLSTLMQKVISRDNWSAGNSVVFILQGDGNRLADGFAGQGNAAAELIVTFTTQNAPPSVDSGTDQHLVWSDSAVLNGSVMDDGLPAAPGPVDLRWTVVSGPGSVVFSDPTSLATNARFNTAGTYQLLLTATDGQLTAFDEVSITVSPIDR